MRNFIGKTVFHPIEKGWRPDKVLAVLFHRSAAITYLIYFFWGLASVFGSLPTLVAAQGDLIGTFFSLLVAPISLLAFIGATYFPKYARLEMYAAGSLVTLVIVYEILTLLIFFQGDVAHGVGFILNLSHIVLPISRVIFTYVTLLKQAGEENV